MWTHQWSSYRNILCNTMQVLSPSQLLCLTTKEYKMHPENSKLWRWRRQMFMYNNFVFFYLRLEVWIKVRPEHTCIHQIMETLQQSHVKDRGHVWHQWKQTYITKKGKVSDDWRAEQVLYGFTALISSLLLIHNFISESSWKALQKKDLTAGPDELKLKPPSF